MSSGMSTGEDEAEEEEKGAAVTYTGHRFVDESHLADADERAPALTTEPKHFSRCMP